MKERYEIAGHQLYLYDEELGMDLSSPFFLPQLPQDLSIECRVSHPAVMVLKRDKEGKIQKAALEIEGRKHGECVEFYPTGELFSRCFYQEGNLHGPSLFYTLAGGILSETWFYCGVIQGKVRQYYASGKLYALQRYRDGKRTGLQEYYYEDGSIRTRMYYENGTLHGEVRLFWPSGKLKRMGHYHQGKSIGKDQIWNEKGELLEESQFEERTSP